MDRGAVKELRYILLRVTRGVSNETKRNSGSHVSALAPLVDASHYGRHRSWDIEGRELKHCAARPRGLPVRDTRAPRTAIGARHNAAHRIVRSSHARHAYEGGTLRRDRQIPRRLFLRLDTLGARRAGGLHPDPLGARTVGAATEAAAIAQGDGRWRAGGMPPMPLPFVRSPVGRAVLASYRSRSRIALCTSRTYSDRSAGSATPQRTLPNWTIIVERGFATDSTRCDRRQEQLPVGRR